MSGPTLDRRTSRARWRRSPRSAGSRDVVGALAAEQARRGHRVAGRAARLPRRSTLPAGLDARGRSAAPRCRGGMGREPARFELLRRRPTATALRVAAGRPRRRAALLRPPRHLRRSRAPARATPTTPSASCSSARAALEGLERLGERFDVAPRPRPPGGVGAVLRAHARRRRAARSATRPRCSPSTTSATRASTTRGCSALAGFGARAVLRPAARSSSGAA